MPSSIQSADGEICQQTDYRIEPQLKTKSQQQIQPIDTILFINQVRAIVDGCTILMLCICFSDKINVAALHCIEIFQHIFESRSIAIRELVDVVASQSTLDSGLFWCITLSRRVSAYDYFQLADKYQDFIHVY